MHINITTPIKAYLTNYTQEELDSIRKQLTYTNTSVSFNIQKLKKQHWFKRNNPDAFEARLKELEAQKKTTLVFEDELGIYIRPGSISYLEGILYTVTNNIFYPAYKPIPWKHEPEFKPYPFQTEGVSKLIAIKHGSGSYSTGLGKSYIIESIAQTMGLKTIIVTPSQIIFEQLYRDCLYLFGKDRVGAYGDGYHETDKLITVAISKSLTMLKPEMPNYKKIQKNKVMIIDECHSFASEQLEKVCHGVLSEVPYRSLLSATIERNDGTDKLLQSIVGTTVCHMNIKQGIDGGYLKALKFKVLSVISPSSLYKDDPMECKRTHFLHNINIANLAAKLANSMWTVKRESTLILVEELQQLSMLKDLIKVPFTYVHSSSKKEAAEWGLKAVDKQVEIERFNRGEISCLAGSKSILCGTNIFGMSTTINWIGGNSDIVTFQGAMGRSTRKVELSKYKDFHKPVPFVTIIDFDVANQPILNKQLQNRIDCYETTGEKVNFI